MLNLNRADYYSNMLCGFVLTSLYFHVFQLAELEQRVVEAETRADEAEDKVSEHVGLSSNFMPSITGWQAPCVLNEAIHIRWYYYMMVLCRRPCNSARDDDGGAVVEGRVSMCWPNHWMLSILTLLP